MKAIIQNRYGDIETLELVDVDMPICNDHDIRVNMHYTNISIADKHLNTLDLPLMLSLIMRLVFGFKKPKARIRGLSGSGIVTDIGSKVTRFRVGDHVNFINSMKASALAEYIVLNENQTIAKIHPDVPLQDASPIAFGALSANHFINSHTIKKDDQVMIYGASGAVGSYAASLAKLYQAHVTVVSSPLHHNKLSVLHPDMMVTYHDEAYLKIDQRFDVIFDAVGKISKKKVKHLLKHKGKFYTVKSPTKESRQRLENLNMLLKEHKLKTIMDTMYPLNDFKLAHKKVYEGHKTGNIVIDMQSLK